MILGMDIVGIFRVVGFNGERTLKMLLNREIKEELGVEINILALIPRIFSPIRNNWHGLLICYLCEMKKSTLIILNHESMDYGWFSLEEIKKLKTLPLAYEVALGSGKVFTPENLIKFSGARGGSRTSRLASQDFKSCVYAISPPGFLIVYLS